MFVACSVCFRQLSQQGASSLHSSMVGLPPPPTRLFLCDETPLQHSLLSDSMFTGVEPGVLGLTKREYIDEHVSLTSVEAEYEMWID